MTELLTAVQSEQKRQSDEIAAMRTMHLDLMQGMSELVAKLSILEVQYREGANREAESRRTLKEHGDKIEDIRRSMAANEYFVGLVKSANRNIFLAALAAMASAGFAFLK